MIKNFTYFIFTLFLISLTLACGNDDEEMMIPMEEEEPTVDLTTTIVGGYTGTNLFGEGGSFFSEENRRATVTRTTDSTATIAIRSSFAGTINLGATMDTDSTFRVGDVDIFDDGPYNGTGTVDDQQLDISLTASGGKRYTYDGERD